MADNLSVKDSAGTSRSLAAKDIGGIHHPEHIIAGPDGTPQDLLAALLQLAPASGAIAVTPNDVTTLANVRSLKIGTGGTLVATIGGSNFTFTVSDGELLPVKATKVLATGTTATGIVALT